MSVTQNNCFFSSVLKISKYIAASIILLNGLNSCKTGGLPVHTFSDCAIITILYTKNKNQ